MKKIRRKTKKHVEEGKSISHVCELYKTKDKDNFKYYINLYKRYGEKPFINREKVVYRRYTKSSAVIKS